MEGSWKVLGRPCKLRKVSWKALENTRKALGRPGKHWKQGLLKGLASLVRSLEGPYKAVGRSLKGLGRFWEGP